MKLENTAFGSSDPDAANSDPTTNISASKPPGFLNASLRNDPEMSFDNTDINYHHTAEDPLESYRLIDTPVESPAPSVVLTVA